MDEGKGAVPREGRGLEVKILFAFKNGHWPEFSGGVQSNTDYLARALKNRGHEVSVLCSLFGRGRFGLLSRAKLKIGRLPWVCDTQLGYSVFRAWNVENIAAQLARHLRADVVVPQCHQTVPVAHAIMGASDAAVVPYFHNVEFDELGGDPRLKGVDRYISNSDFTAKKFGDEFGIVSEVIPPIIEHERYACDGRGEYVTFINPIEKKGLHIAAALAEEFPQIPFLFVRSWDLSAEQDRKLDEACRGRANISVVQPTSDMRKIYRKTKILIAPSQWAEAWGRVASEAQCSGIPVLGSHIGGLTEAIGPGGITLPSTAPVREWAEALGRLLKNEDMYRSLSASAFRHAQRPEANPDHQIARLELILQQAVHSRSKSLEV